MFSDGFLEGQTRDINEGFPSDSDPYAEHYEYLSDSDLEDEKSCSEEEGEGEGGDDESREDDRLSQQRLEDTPGPTTLPTVVSDPPSSIGTSAARNNDRSISFAFECCPNLVHNPNYRPNRDAARMGKVAIIHDMGAVTCVRHSPRQPILAPYKWSQLRGDVIFFIYWPDRVCPV